MHRETKNRVEDIPIEELTRAPAQSSIYTSSRKKVRFFDKRWFLIGIVLLFSCIYISAHQLYSKSSTLISKRIINIKIPRPDFTGRKSYLSFLRGELSNIQHNSPSKIIGLWGRGGFGKSELAIHFANTNQERFSLLWLFCCDSEPQMNQGYRDLADRLNILVPTDSTEKIKQRVHTFLETAHFDEPWLLIYDNVEAPLASYPQRGGMILVTSQKMVLAPNATVEVFPFSKEEAKELLELITQQKDNRAAESLVDDLYRIPLLINYAASYIKTAHDCKISDYHKMISTHLSSLEGPLWTEMDIQNRYSKNLATSWNITLQSIEKENPLAARILYACSYLHAERIPVEWIERLEQELGKEKTVLKCLLSFRMLEYDALTKTVSIHRFLQEIIRKERCNEANKDLMSTLSLLAQHAQDYNYYDFSTWERGKLWVLHASEVEKWLPLIQNRNVASMRQLAEIHSGVGKWCYFNDLYSQATEAYVKTLEIQKYVHGEESFPVGNTYVLIARTLLEKGQYQETLDYCTKAQKIFNALHVGSTNEIALMLHVMGRVIFQQGDHPEALRLHQQAFQILSKEQLTIESGICFYNIGLCLGHLDQKEEAIKIFDQSLQIFQKLCGKNHPLYARSLYGKAWAIYRQKNYALALKYFNQAYDIFISSQGKDLAYLAHCWNRIGRCYLDLGQPKQAGKIFKKALQRGQEYYGHNTRPVEHSYNGIAWSYLNKRQPKKGLKYLLKQLDVCRHVYHKAPKKISHILKDFQEGFTKAAIDGASLELLQHAARRAYSVSEQELGDSHPLTIFFHNQSIIEEKKNEKSH